MAMLALNQEKQSTAIKVLQTPINNFVTQQIKLMAMADMSFTNEVIESIAHWTNDEKLSKHQFSEDVVSLHLTLN